MATQALLMRGTYRDSITLMSVMQAIKAFAGVEDASAIMATEANLELLRRSNLLPTTFLSEQESAPSADDLLVVVRAAEAEQALVSLRAAEARLSAPGAGGGTPASGDQRQPRSLESALKRCPEANLAVVSVAGEHAWLEAEQALRHGLHVFLFSDNVPIERERALKSLATERGLLLMGPDCGTAMIDGVALGFCNVVPRGTIGIAGASGTGMQQVMSLVAGAGMGISQAIGTGGHDLSESIGGAMTRRAVELLIGDPETQVIVLVSKPPAPTIAASLLAASVCAKPVVAVFIGLGTDDQDLNAWITPNITLARTLDEGAAFAVTAAGGEASHVPRWQHLSDQTARLAVEQQLLAPTQRYLRALFAGGTLCAEALHVMRESLIHIASNLGHDSGEERVDGAGAYAGHVALDLGADEFTWGRPHPMIDPTLRLQHIARVAADPTTGVLLLDVILGYGTHADPAAIYAPAIARARSVASDAGRYLPVIISLCGTEADPQIWSRQQQAFEHAGALVYASNAAAARAAALLVPAADANSSLPTLEAHHGR